MTRTCDSGGNGDPTLSSSSVLAKLAYRDDGILHSNLVRNDSVQNISRDRTDHNYCECTYLIRFKYCIRLKVQ